MRLFFYFCAKFLYKATSDGAIVWAKSLGGSSYDGDIGLGVDPDGNVYMAGGFIDKLYLGDSLLLSAGIHTGIAVRSMIL